MSDSSTEDIEYRETETGKTETIVKQSFSDAIRELKLAVLGRYPNKKTSNHTFENEQGLIMIDVLRKYHREVFGKEDEVLNMLADSKIERTMSVNGYGLKTFKDVVHGINIGFEQHEIPETGLLRRIAGKR